LRTSPQAPPQAPQQARRAALQPPVAPPRPQPLRVPQARKTAAAKLLGKPAARLPPPWRPALQLPETQS
jgi:hypothetical protein